MIIETVTGKCFDVIFIVGTYDKRYFVACCLLFKLKTI